jgi:hypothetical protein
VNSFCPHFPHFAADAGRVAANLFTLPHWLQTISLSPITASPLA